VEKYFMLLVYNHLALPWMDMRPSVISVFVHKEDSALQIVELMDKVEAIFTEHFAQENRRHAMSALRPMQQKASHTVTYLFGLFSGCSLALLTSFGILLKVAGDYNTATKDNYLRSIFPTFGHAISLCCPSFFFVSYFSA
jgi:hypothetical protein